MAHSCNSRAKEATGGGLTQVQGQLRQHWKTPPEQNQTTETQGAGEMVPQVIAFTAKPEDMRWSLDGRSHMVRERTTSHQLHADLHMHTTYTPENTHEHTTLAFTTTNNHTGIY